MTPTYRRPDLLVRQYQAVLRQSDQNFEWLILDDSPEPCPYFQALADTRVRYQHDAGGRLGIGAKRNWLVDRARGEIIAHFDDDDYYAPGYLAAMQARLTHRGADIVKLSSWFVYAAVSRKLGYWDTAQTRGLHFRFYTDKPIVPEMWADKQSEVYKNNYAGYGFSYVYRKTIWRDVPFPDVVFNEDYGFVSAALARGCRLEHFADSDGLCLHIVRRDNMAICYPQHLLPDFLFAKLFPPEAIGFAEMDGRL